MVVVGGDGGSEEYNHAVRVWVCQTVTGRRQRRERKRKKTKGEAKRQFRRERREK